MRLNNNSNKPMWIEIYEFDISYYDIIGSHLRYDFRNKIYSGTRHKVGLQVAYIQDIMNNI
jgi:hypothetical protein